jgi:ABC-type uncharacterized transport system auxiliary subunit
MKRRFWLLLSLLCAACAAPHEAAPPPAIFVLSPASSACRRMPEKGPVVAVTSPRLPPGLGTDKIALYLEGGRRLDYFGAASWPSGLGDMLQDFIVRAARGGCRSLTAVRADPAVMADETLLVDVGDFGPVYAHGPDALPFLKISMTFTLVSAHDGKVLGVFMAAETGRARANTLSAVASGMQALLRKATDKAWDDVTLTLSGTAAPGERK